MKIFKNVRSTAENVPAIEVNTTSSGTIDTIYVRYDIERIEETEFSGWNIGTEIHYTIKEFLKKVSTDDDLGTMAMLLSITLAEIDMLKMQIGGM